MSLLIDTGKLLPRDTGRPPKGVYGARDRLDAVVGRFTAVGGTRTKETGAVLSHCSMSVVSQNVKGEFRIHGGCHSIRRLETYVQMPVATGDSYKVTLSLLQVLPVRVSVLT